jgi:hypothetical protein
MFRAELKNPQYKVRFGLLLEAYLRYCGEYGEDLGRQVRTVDKLTFIAEIIQNSTHDELYNQVCFIFLIIVIEIIHSYRKVILLIYLQEKVILKIYNIFVHLLNIILNLVNLCKIKYLIKTKKKQFFEFIL